MAPTDYFSDDAIRSDLRAKAVRGGLYTGAAQVANVVISLAAVPLLGRLLDPADFGLVAMVAVFTNFARMFVDAGLSAATVQRDRITHEQVTNLFWVASALGAAIALIVASLSPGIAWLYGEPRLVPITLALTASYLLAGLTIQHHALLRRTMRFREMAAIQVAAVVAAQTVGVAWAWRYRGEPHDYWALVMIPLVNAGVTMIGAWLACSWRPGFPRRGVGVRTMLSFGAHLTGANLAAYLARNADKLLLGWWAGEQVLGFYVQAYRILLYPMQAVFSPLGGVVMPTLSRLTGSVDRYRRIYAAALLLMLLTMSPGAAAIGVTAHWWIALVLGPGWEESTTVLRCLSIVGVIQPLISSCGWLSVSQGASKLMLKNSLFNAAAIVVSFAIGLPWGAWGVAAGFAVSMLLCCLPAVLFWLDSGGVFPARLLLRSASLAMIPVTAVVASNAALLLLAGPLDPVSGCSASACVTVIAWAVGVFAFRPTREALFDAVRLARGMRRTESSAAGTNPARGVT